MIKLSFRSRISFYFISITAVLIAVLFFAIYLMVFNTVYEHLDSDLDAETDEIYSGIAVLNNGIHFSNQSEWSEAEHGRNEVNPVFIQVVDTLGNIIRKNPNLAKPGIVFRPHITSQAYFDTYLDGAQIRQLQTPIVNPIGKTLGYLLIAIPLRESLVVLDNLKYTLLVGYPLALMILFLLSRFIAGSAISPVNRISSTAARITNENLDERIELPHHNDELLVLTKTINQLLDRLGNVILREKQFTADASHELRTPLSIIKGTLEVLIRKPREPQQYIEKITTVISEVDRISFLVDQLLELSKYENSGIFPKFRQVKISDVISESVTRLLPLLNQKKITIESGGNTELSVYADPAMLDVIFENLISNAVKYSPEKSRIEIFVKTSDNKIILSVTDHGLGIPPEQIDRIFDRFYRIDESRNSKIAGKGLGLAIAKRLVDLQNMELSVKSELNKGTTFYLSCNT